MKRMFHSVQQQTKPQYRDTAPQENSATTVTRSALLAAHLHDLGVLLGVVLLLVLIVVVVIILVHAVLLLATQLRLLLRLRGLVQLRLCTEISEYETCYS